MDRTVGVFDLTSLVVRRQCRRAAASRRCRSVGTEKLSATVLKGKQLFYDARDTRLARDALHQLRYAATTMAATTAGSGT